MFRKRQRSEKQIIKKFTEEEEDHVDLKDDKELTRKRARQEASGNFHSTSTQEKESKAFMEQETKGLKFQAKAQLTGKSVEKVATRELNIDDDEDGFERAKKNIELSEQMARGKLKPNVYVGEAGYANYVKLTEDDLRAKRIRGTLGPLKAPTNIRSTVRVDYQKYLCKDYNQNGYCGYGDACIYLHDRYDYKAGWEVDAECEAQERREQLRLQGYHVEGEPDYEIHSDEEANKCPICEQELNKPVATQCGDVFCESCALKHYGKSDKCFVCDKETNGIFNLVREKVVANKTEVSEMEKVFKEYKENQDRSKEKTYKPVSGWIIP